MDEDNVASTEPHIMESPYEVLKVLLLGVPHVRIIAAPTGLK
jgi:hypothetical protein